MKTTLKIKYGQPSWRLAAGAVELFVTQTGAHVGPMTFRLGDRKIQPFSVAPWAEEDTPKSLPPMLKALRGDFFCLPFGGNETPLGGERHPPHGDTANRCWTLEAAQPGQLHLSLRTKARKGRVDKFVSLQPDQTAVYQRHVISGMSGPMSFGHHAMLKFPDRPGCGRISTSRFLRGQVAPIPFEKPEARGYSTLRPGAAFQSLREVPMQTGELADLTRYPVRRGFEDLVLLESDPSLPFAWTAVTFSEDGHVWFALKNPRVLRQTILWISNGGRHYAPWNGRHVDVLGLEEVTSYFHYGLAESAAKNPIAASGQPTCQPMNPAEPLEINYVMALAAVPRKFDEVKTITPAADGKSVKLTAGNGVSVNVSLDLAALGLGMLKLTPVS